MWNWNGNRKEYYVNQYIKSDKIPYIIYADMDSLIKKNVCANTPENWATTKISEHVPCG